MLVLHAQQRHPGNQPAKPRPRLDHTLPQLPSGVSVRKLVFSVDYTLNQVCLGKGGTCAHQPMRFGLAAAAGGCD